MTEENKIRLNKFISSNYDFARRKIDEFILQGRVTVNNKVITEQGLKIDPEKDDVKLDGERIKSKHKKIYILLNKPKGFITSTDDEKNRKTVIDLLNIRERVFPVGRLDYDSSGLLILTNDGELANKLMHPKNKIEKTYYIEISRPLDDKIKEKFEKGILLEGKKTLPAKISFPKKDDRTKVTITISEGRNRQVRKMFEKFGMHVRLLHRTGYGNLTLSGLKQGEWRKLTIKDFNNFFKEEKNKK